MSRRNAMLFVLVLGSIAVATYAASCSCGNPTQPPATPPGLPLHQGQGSVPPLDARGGRGSYASSRHALTTTVTTDADFLTANRGYGIVEDTSVSAGIIRRTLGLPNFGLANANPTVDGWQSTTSLTIARSAHGTITVNGFIYVIGGDKGIHVVTDDVSFASVKADGTVSAWNTTQKLPKTIWASAVVAHNGTIYVIGGDNAGALSDVYSAKPNSDGSITAWQSLTPLAKGREGPGAVVYNGTIYVAGGRSGSSYYDDVEYSKIMPDGSLAAWTTSASKFTAGRQFHSSVVDKGRLYVIGGQTGASSYTDKLQYVTLKADGSLGTWSQEMSLPENRGTHASAAYNGYLYVYGGATSAYSADVKYAPINVDGTLGAWNSTTSLPSARGYVGGMISNGFLYSVGGFFGSAAVPEVLFAPIRPNGEVGKTWISTTSFSGDRTGHTSVIHNGFVYVIGGDTNGGNPYRDDVQFASINADGTVGMWNPTISIPEARYNHASAIYNGYLYVMGGMKNGGGAASDVWFSKANTDGTLGSWTVTTPLPAVRGAPTGIAYKGFLYVMGGYDTTEQNTVWVAAINPDGSLGTWNLTSPFGTARLNHASAVCNGYMYVIGGCVGINCLSSVQVAPINTNGTLGSWSATTPLPATRGYLTSIVENGYVYVFGGDAGGWSTDVLDAKINPDGTLGNWSTTTSFLAPGRCNHSTVEHNGYVYVLGGYSINPVQFAPINANGTVGEWKNTSDMPEDRSWFGTVVQEGNLYVIGGGGSTYRNDSKYTNILSDGNIGQWKNGASFTTGKSAVAAAAYHDYLFLTGGSTNPPLYSDVLKTHLNSDGSMDVWSATTSLATELAGHQAIAYDGYLYAVGGENDSGLQNAVNFTKINVDGTIGNWAQTTSFNTPRWFHSTFVNGGRMYVLGGQKSGGYCNDVQFAAINGDGSLGDWNATTSFTGARQDLKCVVLNGYVYLMGGYDGSSYYNDVQFAALNSDGTLNGWVSANPFQTKRYGHQAIAQDGRIYVLGGTNPPTRLKDVQFAPITAFSTSTKSSFSKQFDLGALGRFNSIKLDGTLGGVNSELDVSFRIAGIDAAYGAWTTPVAVTSLPGTLPVSSGDGQYIDVSVTINDNGRLGVTSGMGSSEVSELAVDYLKANGVSCAADTDCVSNHCAGTPSLFCCDNACNTPNQCQTAGSCTTGTCLYGNKANTTTCNDGNACTKDDRCDGAGGCAGTAYSCPAPNQCQTSVTCDGAGGCTIVNKLVSDACSLGDSCSINDHCDGNGNCVSGGVNPACMDAGTPDAGQDGGVDTGPTDAGTDTGLDAGIDGGVDTGMVDAGQDAATPDSGTPDSGNPDAGADTGQDTGLPDSGILDAGADANIVTDTGTSFDAASPPDGSKEKIIGDMYSCSCATVGVD